MYHKFVFSILILSLVGLGFFLNHFTQTNDVLKRYQKFGFLKSDFKYEKVEKTWGEQGLIFYQVQFPFLDIPIRANRMKIYLKDTGINIDLKKVHLNVTQGLKKKYGSRISQNLNEYVPYRDFMDKFMTTMALMGVDEFIGDISINTLYSDIKTMQFKVDMKQKNDSTVLMTGTIHLPIVGAHQLSDLWKGDVSSAKIKVKKNLFEKYINYAKSRKIGFPKNIKDTTLKFKQEAGKILQLKSILN